MKVYIAIVVYNRFQNVKHWLECWEKCDQQGAQVVVIHNNDKEIERYQTLVEEAGGIYINRPNIGFDIGAFQDVCKSRLKGFPEWERVLWLTDDTFPMQEDFVKQFTNCMKPGVGVAAMKISKYVTRHIRTTGFMIDRQTAERLEFPADPVVTKMECFYFEHKWKGKVFYDQIVNMGLQAVQVAEDEVSPLWDVGYHRRLKRDEEHRQRFGGINTGDKILFICPIYKSYPAICSSLIMQTHGNWELLLIHDGPESDGVAEHIPEDPRITYFDSPKHGGYWGHYIRSVAIQEYRDKADYFVITNPDNYYVPTFCKMMLDGFKTDKIVASYCSDMVHSYRAWQVIPCSLKRGFLDSGGVMLRSDVAAEVGWTDIETHSADWNFFNDILKQYPSWRWVKINGCLFVHN